MATTTYLVTGANRGLGLEFARALSGRGEGHEVIGTARRPREATDLAKFAKRVVELDVADPASIAGLRERVGETPIDVLINNAGVSSKGRSVTEVDAAELAHAFAVNASAAVLVVRALLPNLRAGKRKLIVNITSQLGSIANNSGGSTYGYRASKAALNMFTVCMSNELKGEGFTVVAVHPGWVRTDMGGRNATLSVEESVGAMLKTLGALREEDTGRFLNYDGTGLPW